MKTKFNKNGVTIKSILSDNKCCLECYFGEEYEEGCWKRWRCSSKIKKWNIPDCVFDYDIGKSRIYIKI